jgi:hypothetical protein
MARVLQCPACGHAHALGALPGTPTFPCAECGRTLRTPTELVRPGGSDGAPVVRTRERAGRPPTEPPRRTSRAGPARGAPAAAPTGAPVGKAARSGRETRPGTPRPPRAGHGGVTLGLRIGAWIVAVVIGFVCAWLVGTTAGLISRAQVVDMFRSSTITNYWRLLLFVPVWAFMSACLATLVIEGVRWFRARSPRPVGTRPAPADGPEPSRPVLRQSVPDAEPREDAPPPATPPGQRTRIRPREPTL